MGLARWVEEEAGPRGLRLGLKRACGPRTEKAGSGRRSQRERALLVLLWSRDEAAMAGGRREARAMAFDGTGEAVSLHGGGWVEIDGKRHSGEVREA